MGAPCRSAEKAGAKVSGAHWKIGDRVRLRRGAALYPKLGAGSFVVIEVPHGRWLLGTRGARLWSLRKTDLIRMGKAI
jgi:hypothetical protein